MSQLDHIITPAGDAEPAGAVVLLHGRGTDQHDLARFLGVLDQGHRLVHVTPGAPLGGGAIRHWYESGTVGHPDPETFRTAYRLLDAFLTALPERTGVPWERTVIGGFSQGAGLAYALGFGDASGTLPARPQPAGLLAMSGGIPTVPGFELALDGRQGFPACIAHGSLDELMPIAFAQAARDRLAAAQADVTYLESPMGHVIDPRVLPDVQRWLHARVG